MKIAVPRVDAETLLIRALRVSAAFHGIAITLRTASARPWASATFEGTRHELQLELGGADAAAWLALLPEAELPMRGHIVADLSVDAITDHGDYIAATLTALTLAER